jgi:hypothetical protein
MRALLNAWFLAAALSLGGVAQASAAEDCRLSGAWVTPGGDEIYTFTQTADDGNDGTFTYESKTWSLTLHGTYFLENDDGILHLRFFDASQQQHDDYYRLTMSSAQDSMFTIEAVQPNPAMPTGPQTFYVRDTYARGLNLSLCKT